jgi:hypothetical protein
MRCLYFLNYIRTKLNVVIEVLRQSVNSLRCDEIVFVVDLIFESLLAADRESCVASTSGLAHVYF